MRGFNYFLGYSFSYSYGPYIAYYPAGGLFGIIRLPVFAHKGIDFRLIGNFEYA